MKLYDENGWVDIGAILTEARKNKIAFIMCWGGRGTGKTYGALKEVVESRIPFMLMRRTQTQMDIISKPEFSPFKSINRDLGVDIGIAPLSKYNSGIYNMEEVDGKKAISGEPIGYTCALTTVANIRGFDASEIKLLIYDEFIPEPHSRPIKCESDAFLNAYETINRNRELKGEEPLIALCLANSNALDNPLFIGLGLVTKADKMNSTGQEYSIDSKRGIMLVNLCKSKISEQKANTALYKLTSGSEFAKMALSNDFLGEGERGRIGARPLREYKPIVAVGELCIYMHKYNDLYYCTTHFSGTPPTYGAGDTERARFRRLYGWIWGKYLDRKVDFEERICEILLTKYVE